MKKIDLFSTLAICIIFQSAGLTAQQGYSSQQTQYGSDDDFRYPNRGEPAPYGTDWNYQESWRHNKKAYYEGQTQPEAWRNAHPYGPGGIGYDPAPNYVSDGYKDPQHPQHNAPQSARTNNQTQKYRD